MLRVIVAYIVLVCLLLQWIPDTLHALVHTHEEHTHHANPLDGELAFDVAHKHCKNPEKALNSAWVRSSVSKYIATFSYIDFATRKEVQQCLEAYDFKSGRAPPEIVRFC